MEVNTEGNTPLHYAVASRDYPTIWHLLSSNIPRQANSSGESAADWFRSYRNHLDTSDDVDRLPEKISRGDFGFFVIMNMGTAKMPWDVRFEGGNTPLHLAFLHGQTTLAHMIANVNPDLLHIKNTAGLKPHELAPATLNIADPSSFVVKDIQRLFNSSNLNTKAANDHLPSISVDTLDVEALDDLLKNSNDWMSTGNFSPLTPYIPCLWLVAQSFCEKALHFLEKIECQTTPPLDYHNWKLIRGSDLLSLCFGRNYDIKRVHRRISAIHSYLRSVSSDPRSLRESISFSSHVDVEFWNSFGEGGGGGSTLYLNPTQTQHVITLVLRLLAEISHKVNNSFPILFHPLRWITPTFAFDLGSTREQLAARFLAGNVVPLRKLVILATQEILDRRTDGGGNFWLETGVDERNHTVFYPRFEDWSWLGYENSDTLSLAAVGLTGILAGAATINKQSLLLVSETLPFMKELHDPHLTSDLMSLTESWVIGVEEENQQTCSAEVAGPSSHEGAIAVQLDLGALTLEENDGQMES